MKKMTFALACASAVAAFAWEAPVLNAIGFEDYTLTDGSFTGLSNKKDNGTDASAPGDSFWLYVGASNSEDASTVKAYDSAKTGNSNYLELSTEGGTLWRSINGLSSATTLGAAQEVSAETGLYIDTMVQFTPTEDGGAPDLDPSDKLAIWLNVKDNVTNLCVQALQAKSEFSANVPQTFVLNNAAGNLTINAGEWYRLKVKVNRLMDVMTAYEIFIGNDQLKAVGDELPWDASSAALFAESPLKDQIAANQLFVSLKGTSETAPALTAVGFKGSGAIDSLQFTTQDPGGEDPAPVVKVGLTISAENATVTGITAGEVEVGSSLTFTVTAAEGYNLTGVTINGTTVTADADGNYTYTVADTDEAVAVVVTTEAIPSIDWNNPKAESGTATEMFGITGALATADGQKLAAWAQNVGKVSFDKASEIKTDAFLLNCANTDDAITAAKKDFVIPAITVGADGKVTVTPPNGDFNGVVTIKGATAVDGDYNLAADAAGAKFFKAFLSLPAAE